jgi:hypothetical protein
LLLIRAGAEGRIERPEPVCSSVKCVPNVDLELGALWQRKEDARKKSIDQLKKFTPNQAICHSKFDLQVWVSLRSKHLEEKVGATPLRENVQDEATGIQRVHRHKL